MNNLNVYLLQKFCDYQLLGVNIKDGYISDFKINESNSLDEINGSIVDEINYSDLNDTILATKLSYYNMDDYENDNKYEEFTFTEYGEVQLLIELTNYFNYLKTKITDTWKDI